MNNISMLLEILIGAILIAFGVMSIFFSIEEGISDQRLMGIFILGLLSVGAGIYVLVNTLTLILLLKKITGLVLGIGGLFFILGFPDITDYQPEGMGRAGIFIGIVLLVIGIWLLFF